MNQEVNEIQKKINKLQELANEMIDANKLTDDKFNKLLKKIQDYQLKQNKIIDKDDAYKIQYSQINLSEAQQTKFDLVLEKTTQKREDLNTIKDKLSRMEFPPLQEEEIFDEIAKIKFDHHFLFFSIYTFSLLIICGFEGFWNTLFLNEIVMYNILFLIFPEGNTAAV